MKRLLLLPVLLSLACTTDWATDGTIGWRHVDVKARGVDVVPVFVAAPWNGQGPVTAADGAVIVPANDVPPSRYEWLAKALARRGYAVALPSFPLDTPALSTPDVQVARRVLVDGHAPSMTPALATRRLVVMGHGQGGAIAAREADDFDALVLLGSAGDGKSDFAGPVLSITGDLDCDTPPEDVREALGTFEGRKLFALVEGLTRHGFTDSLNADRKTGCSPQMALDEGHALIVTLIDGFLTGALEPLPGVTLEEVR